MLTGACRCGAVRYRVASDLTPLTYACHCTICQRVTGSSFAHQMPVVEAELSVDGDLIEVSVVGPSGATGVNRHCPSCLTRIYNTNDRRPGLAIVRAGTIDGSERLVPALHMFVSTKQPWIVLPDDVPTFDENAPMELWARLLA